MKSPTKRIELAVNLMQVIQQLGGGEIRLPVPANDFEALAVKLLPLSRLAIRLSKRATAKARQLHKADREEIAKLHDVVNEQAELLELRRIERAALRRLYQKGGRR